MARKKALKDEVLNEVQGGVNLNELNERILNFESKTDELAKQINAVSQKSDVLEANIKSLLKADQLKDEVKTEKNLRNSILKKFFGGNISEKI